MFGTIAHATLKPGMAARLAEFNAEWDREIRPLVPGAFMELAGHAAGRPDQIVFVALAEDEAAYRALAALPAQHAFYLRFNECFEGEPTWEDVQLDWVGRH